MPFLLVHIAMLLLGKIILMLCGRPTAGLLPALLAAVFLSSCGALAAVFGLYGQEQRRHTLELHRQALALQTRALEIEQRTLADMDAGLRTLGEQLEERLQAVRAALAERAGQTAQEQVFQTAQWLRGQSAPATVKTPWSTR